MNEVESFANVTRRAVATDKKQIDFLRMSSYKTSPQFVVDRPEKLNWMPEDSRNIVIAAFNACGCAISTMQGAVVHEIEEMRTYMEAELPDLVVEFPCLVLTAAATHSDYHGRGFNSLLRLLYLEASIRDNIKSVAGAVFDGAPRVNLMNKLGYCYFQTGAVSYDVLTPKTSRRIAVLHSSSFQQAVAVLASCTKGPHAEYPWEGKQLALITNVR